MKAAATDGEIMRNIKYSRQHHSLQVLICNTHRQMIEIGTRSYILSSDWFVTWYTGSDWLLTSHVIRCDTRRWRWVEVAARSIIMQSDIKSARFAERDIINQYSRGLFAEIFYLILHETSTHHNTDRSCLERPVNSKLKTNNEIGHVLFR